MANKAGKAMARGAEAPATRATARAIEESAIRSASKGAARPTQEASALSKLAEHDPAAARKWLDELSRASQREPSTAPARDELANGLIDRLQRRLPADHSLPPGLEDEVSGLSDLSSRFGPGVEVRLRLLEQNVHRRADLATLERVGQAAAKSQWDEVARLAPDAAMRLAYLEEGQPGVATGLNRLLADVEELAWKTAARRRLESVLERSPREPTAWREAERDLPVRLKSVSADLLQLHTLKAEGAGRAAGPPDVGIPESCVPPRLGTPRHPTR